MEPVAAAASAAPSPRAPGAIVGMAIAAELTYLAVVVIPLVPLMLVQWFFFGPAFAAWTALLLTLGMWWLVQAAAGEPRGATVPGRTPLHAEVAGLCRELDAPPLDRVLLTDSLNASAYQTRGFLSVLGVRRTLSIGIPLLRLLTAQELRAVLAHELGHFSRNHGRMGHWVYLVRSKWESYLHGSGRGDGFVDLLLRSMARRFVPPFLQQSSAWSKACEFEADADAARVGGGDVLGRALARTELAAFLLEGAMRAELDALRLAQPQAPRDHWERLHALVARASEEQFRQAVQAAERQPRRLHDTHPLLRERVAALHGQLRRPEWPAGATCAGEALLGAEWPALLRQCEERWQAQRRIAWRLDHVRLQAASARLRGDTVPAWERAVLVDELHPGEAPRARLLAAADAEPGNAPLQYHAGRRQLADGDARGVQRIERAIELDRRLAVAGCSQLHAFAVKAGTDAEVDRAHRQLEAAVARLEVLAEPLREKLLRGPLHPLAAAKRAVLASALRDDAFIDGCWGVRTEVASPKGRGYEVDLLVVRLDTATLQRAGSTEHDVQSAYAELLQAICEPHHLVRIHTVLTTEPFHPALLAQLRLAPDSCLLPPCTRINADILRIDSL